MYFSSNIKFLRKRKSRTQDEVATALKLKRSTLSGYENSVGSARQVSPYLFRAISIYPLTIL